MASHSHPPKRHPDRWINTLMATTFVTSLLIIGINIGRVL